MIRKRPGIWTYILLTVLLMGIMFPVGGAALAEDKNSNIKAVGQYSDIDPGDINGVYITYLTARGIMSGFPDGGFHPGQGLTRAQAATMIARAMNLKAGKNGASGFKDTAASHWAAGYIAAAVKAGYITGFPDGTFKPEQKLSRAQAISLVCNLSKQMGTVTGVTLPELKDMNQNHWAARSMAAALDAGLIELKGEGIIQPDSPITRGDLARAMAMLLTTDPDLSSRKLYGTMNIKSGDVYLSRNGGKDSKSLSSTTQVGSGDQVETGRSGEAVINYPDGSSILLKNNSTLKIKQSQGRAYIKKNGQPGTAIDNLEVELKNGKLFAGLSTLASPTADSSESGNPATGMNHRGSRLLASVADEYDLLAANEPTTPWYKTAQKKKVKVKVDMPWGVAAIRGTFWSNSASSEGCDMTVLIGEGSLGAGTDDQGLTSFSGRKICSTLLPNLMAGLSNGMIGPGQSGRINNLRKVSTGPMTAGQAGEWRQVQTWINNTRNNMMGAQGTGQPGTNQGNPGDNLGESLDDAMAQADKTASNIPGSTGSSGGGSPASTPPPPPPPPLAVLRGLTAGYYHSLQVMNDNTVKAWGMNDDGQVGDGTSTNRIYPVTVPGLSGIVAVSGGYQHTLALRNNGTVYAWGANGSGQLGDGTINPSKTPVQVMIDSTTPLTGITAICAGGMHSLALKNDGTVWAWGHNGFGELGLGSAAPYITNPQQITSLSGITTIAGRFDFSLALKSDGTVWAWGANGYGQLGNNTNTESSVPVQVQDPGDATAKLTGISAIAGGQDFALALKSNGTVRSWGGNWNGQLGDGTNADRWRAVSVSGLNNVTAIDAGSGHAFAFKSDGSLWAWGNNDQGQLGLGDNTKRLAPVQLTAISNIISIATGASHSLAMQSDGTTWAWGNNEYGQLGNHSKTSSTVPVKVNYSTPPNQAPTAVDVRITGAALAGNTLTGHYTYQDNDGDAEDTAATIYKWYKGPNADGTSKTEIVSAAGTTIYTLDFTDEGSYIFFEVSPAAVAGPSPGAPGCGKSLVAVNVSGNIDTSTTWNEPLYYVSDNITVASGATLTVNPGTIVKIAEGKSITISGGADLQAVGDSANYIHFTDYRDDIVGEDTNGDGDSSVPAPGWWNGIVINDTATATLQCFYIKFGGKGSSANIYKVGSGQVTIQNCLILSGLYAGIGLKNTTAGTEPIISDCHISSNGIGIICDNSSPDIIKNSICASTDGIVCKTNASPTIGGSSVNANSISGNSSAGVINETITITVTATFNWWGDSTGPYHATTNPSGLGDQVSDYVNYSDYLTSSP